MININQTSENSKIYIQRNITNDEPVINNYVTEDELSNTLKNYATTEDLSNVEVDLTGYATEQWVDDKGYIKEIPEEYITDIELANKNYVDTSYLNTELEGYAKQSYVDDAIANVGNGNIVELTQSEYNGITPEPDTLYVISDAPEIEIPDTSNFVDKETLNYEIDAINISLSQKQDTLVSGVNIKTINGNDITGGGDIIIESGSGNIVELTQSEYNAIIPDSDTLYLISDSNINTTLKTINGESIIGEGDIKVEASVDLTGYITETELADKNYVDTSYLNGELEEYAKLSYVDEQIGNINNVLENIIG